MIQCEMVASRFFRFELLVTLFDGALENASHEFLYIGTWFDCIACHWLSGRYLSAHPSIWCGQPCEPSSYPRCQWRRCTSHWVLNIFDMNLLNFWMYFLKQTTLSGKNLHLLIITMFSTRNIRTNRNSGRGICDIQLIHEIALLIGRCIDWNRSFLKLESRDEKCEKLNRIEI